MSAWEGTPAGLIRGGTRAAALATVAGPEPVPNASRYPEEARAYRAAWSESRWPVQAPDGSTAVVDNAETRAEMTRLADRGWTGEWLSFPELGLPPAELRPLYAGVRAASARTGTATPGTGEDAAWRQMVAESDYARTPWARRPGPVSDRKPFGFTLPDEPVEDPDKAAAEARRRVAMLLGINRPAAKKDPEGMTPDVTWRPV